MNYFDVIPDDMIYVVISKLKHKSEIVSIKSAYIIIYELLSKINIWYVLIRDNYPKIFDIIKLKGMNNLDQLQMTYFFAIEDNVSHDLINVYMKIKDIKLNEVGYANKDKFANWDQIYDYLIVNKNTKLFIKGSSIMLIRAVSDRDIKYILHMLTFIVHDINYADKTKGPEEPGLVPFLYAYQLNYSAYIFLYTLYEMKKNPRRIRSLLDAVNINGDRHISLMLNKYNIYGNEMTLNALRSMLSDMEKRYREYTNT